MEKFSKKQLISSLKEGDKVDDIFVVKIKKGVQAYVNGYSIQLLLTDSSGKNLEYRLWGDYNEKKIRELYSLIKSDSVLRLKGQVTSYKEKIQLMSNDVDSITVLDESQYSPSDFIHPARKDLEILFAKLKGFIASVENSQIKTLLESIFLDSEFGEKFKTNPGAIEIHHNWVGGLMEHTLEVLEFCMKAKELFSSLNKDLLIAGSLLHDVGKVEELESTSRIKGTLHGQFAGHLILGTVLVNKNMDAIEGFDNVLKGKILHLMASHHGKLEHGSPKEPMFPEAIALYYADELSSKLAEMADFIEGAKNDTEDDFMYHIRNKKNVYLR